MGADTDVGHAFGYFVAPDATATKYANHDGRFDVRDRVCGLQLRRGRQGRTAYSRGAERAASIKSREFDLRHARGCKADRSRRNGRPGYGSVLAAVLFLPLRTLYNLLEVLEELLLLLGPFEHLRL